MARKNVWTLSRRAQRAVRMIKPRRVKWVGYVTVKGKMKKYKIIGTDLLGKLFVSECIFLSLITNL
jgi:hypothetical protein